jgi:hypothetical protein
MIQNARISRIYTITVPTNTRKYIEISLHTQEILHVSTNHVAIFREIRCPHCWTAHVGRHFNIECTVRSVEIIASRGCWRLNAHMLRSPGDLIGKHTRPVQNKDRTFAIKTLFYNILSTLPFKVVLSTSDTPLPTFPPLLECFLECTFCDGARFSYRIFLNLRVFKKRPNFLNSPPTCTEGPLRLQSAPSGRFWQQTAICPVSL